MKEDDSPQIIALKLICVIILMIYGYAWFGGILIINLHTEE